MQRATHVRNPTIEAMRPGASASSMARAEPGAPAADAMGAGRSPPRLSRIAFIGNSLPRHCGIATFTTDLTHAVATASPATQISIVAMTDHDRDYDYPAMVGFEIRDDRPGDYLAAAEFLNSGGFDAVSLQHEFGIFGGEAGEYVLALISRLTMPVITTLHTVLDAPSPAQARVFGEILRMSSKVIVMAERARALLRGSYGVDDEKISVIAHGIPDFPFVSPEAAKAARGFAGRKVILTFGLLSPNKGVEVVIDAMPAILEASPEAVYVVLGATHPNLVLSEGEAYRRLLMARARDLGVEDRVVFLDHFVDKPTLLSFISMCDVYVTPYLDQAQMTSGTLAYSFGLGKAVVSTPYWHAQELLADGKGALVPFSDAAATARAISDLLTDDARRDAMRERAYAISRSMTWSVAAERHLQVFGRARDEAPPTRLDAASGPASLPPIEIGHLLSMCDDTGIMQHAVCSVPDRSHGYCVDDNARGLLLASSLVQSGARPLPEQLTSRFAAFVQHAWNADARRFRNFMGFDRRWLEEQGSEDSHGRTLWALGECVRSDRDAARRRWAAALFAQALPGVEGFSSPRAWAFTLLGLDAYCSRIGDDPAARRLRSVLADRLTAILSVVETADWTWFETGLAYDNARLPQALLATGLATDSPTLKQAGLRTLRWLTALQTAPGGVFRPIGTEGFGAQGGPPAAFDQQPVEAVATISACLAAWRVDADERWKLEARRAFDWFLGENDLGAPLVDVETGSCRDGLHPDRANDNRGAESVLAYLQSLAELSQFGRTLDDRADAPSKLTRGALAPEFTPMHRGPVAPNTVPEPACALSASGPRPGGRAPLQTGHGTAQPQPN